MNLKKVNLKPAKDKSIKRYHPWVFPGAIKSIDPGCRDGEIVEVYSNKGRYLGTGHYQDNSISIRIFEFEQQPINKTYWKTKLLKAFEVRKNIGFTESKETNIYRLVNAEGDDLPGLIIDHYNGTSVIQCHTIGMWLLKEIISDSLKSIFTDVKAIYDKSAETLTKKHIEEHQIKNQFLYGEKNAIFEGAEYGNNFSINWVSGQKTGFFIDQRENRKLLGELSKDKKILNTFCYSGGFSIYALNNGAKEVHSLDSSKKAIELLEKNIELIKNYKKNHRSIVADAMDYIKNVDNDYDIIILDPPAFAKHMNARHKAIQGYKRLNSRAIEQIKPGGIIFTFSCSQVINKELFKKIILSAGINAGRKIKILYQLHQPADHPVNIFHPESEYLKGLVIQVD